MINWEQHFNNPDFQGLPLQEQKKTIDILTGRDPDFRGMPPAERQKAREILYSRIPTTQTQESPSFSQQWNPGTTDLLTGQQPEAAPQPQQEVPQKTFSQQWNPGTTDLLTGQQPEPAKPVVPTPDQSGFSIDLRDSVMKSVTGKIAISYLSEEEKKKVPSLQPGYKHTPAHNLFHSIAGIGVDLPLMSLGNLIGGVGGMFGLLAALNALYDAKLAGQLPKSLTDFSPEDRERLTEIEKKIGFEGAYGFGTGLLLSQLGKLSGTVLSEIGLRKAFNALETKMPYSEFRGIFGGTYTPSKIASAVTNIVTQSAGLTGADVIVDGLDQIKEKFGHNLALISVLTALHMPFAGKRIKIDYKTKVGAAEDIAGELGISRREALRMMDDPEQNKALIDLLTKRQQQGNEEAKGFIDNSTKDVEKQVQNTQEVQDLTALKLTEPTTARKGISPDAILEKNPPDLENIVYDVYPRGYDKWTETRKRAYESQPEIREKMDQAISVIWPEIKKNPDILRNVANDPTILMDYVDTKASGYDSLKPKYQNSLKSEIRSMAKEQLYGHDINKPEEQQPYQVSKPMSLGTEANKESFDAMMKSYNPPGVISKTEWDAMKKQQGIPPEKDGGSIFSDELGQVAVPGFAGMAAKFKERMAQAKIEAEKKGEFIGTDNVAEEVVKQLIGEYDVKKKTTREHLQYLNDKFITSVDSRLGKYTEAGKEFEKQVRKFRVFTELSQGVAEDGFHKAVQPLLFAGKLPKHLNSALFDFMDYGKIKERKIPLTPEEVTKVQEAGAKLRKIMDDIHFAANKIGLQELHRSVLRWEMIKDETGAVALMSGNGKLISRFANEKEAVQYKYDHLYTTLGYIDTYAPHVLNHNVLGDPRQLQKLVEYLVDTKQIKNVPGTAGKNLDQVRALEIEAAKNLVRNGLNTSEKRYGNLQIAREFDIPEEFLKRDVSVIANYMERAINRIERARHFGINDEKLFIQAIKVADEASQKYNFSRANAEWMKAKNLASAVSDRLIYDPQSGAFMNLLMNFNVIRKMATSAIGQIPQVFYGIWRGGPTFFLKGLANIGTPEMQSLIRRSGVNLQTTRKWLTETMGGTSFASKWLEWNQFTRVDAFARTASAATGAFYSDYAGEKIASKFTLSDKGDIVKIRDGKVAETAKDGIYKDREVRDIVRLGLDPKLIIKQKGELTDFQKRVAINKFEVDTNFRAYTENMPEFRQSPTGRMVMQFKSFMYSMSKSVRDNVLKEARIGNFRPLLYMMVSCGITGTITNEIRSWFNGAPSIIKQLSEGDFSKLIDAYAASGALGMGESILHTFKYGDPQLGAAIGDLLKMAAVTARAVKSTVGMNWKQLAQTITKESVAMAPLGPRWRRTASMLFQNKYPVEASDFLVLPREKTNPQEFPTPLEKIRREGRKQRQKIKERLTP